MPAILQGAHPCPSECPLTCRYSIPRRMQTVFCPCGVRNPIVCLVSATHVLDHVPSRPAEYHSIQFSRCDPAVPGPAGHVTGPPDGAQPIAALRGRTGARILSHLRNPICAAIFHTPPQAPRPRPRPRPARRNRSPRSHRAACQASCRPGLPTSRWPPSTCDVPRTYLAWTSRRPGPPSGPNQHRDHAGRSGHGSPLCQEGGCSRPASVRRPWPSSSRRRLTAAAVPPAWTGGAGSNLENGSACWRRVAGGGSGK
jgi:hypothetical protein